MQDESHRPGDAAGGETNDERSVQEERSGRSSSVVNIVQQNAIIITGRRAKESQAGPERTEGESEGTDSEEPDPESSS